MRCEKCGKKRRIASKWDAIRAHYEGWFTRMDGRSYCPRHNPPWVKKWRENQ